MSHFITGTRSIMHRLWITAVFLKAATTQNQVLTHNHEPDYAWD